MAAAARLALVIANETYEDPRFAGLCAPAGDALDMAEVLADPAIGDFSVTSVADQPETRVRRAISGFLQAPDLGDLAVVYLSCHGVLDARGRLYFATRDTDREDLSATAVEANWLFDRLEDCRARAQVVILDCCFSGAFANTKGDNDVGLERRLIGAGRGRTVLTASRGTEYSYEGRARPGAPVVRSAFTAGLVDGLRTGQADRDGKGYITVEDAFDYAAARVKEAGAQQSPQRWTFGGEGEIVLGRVRDASAQLPLPNRSLVVKEPGAGRFDAGAYTGVAFSSDGKVLASAGPGAGVRLCDPANSTPVDHPHEWPGHPVLALAYRPGGDLLVTAGMHRLVGLWRPGSATPAHTLATGVSAKWLARRAEPRYTRAVAFRPDGAVLATGGTGCLVELWDPDTAERIRALPARSVDALSFSADGLELAAAASGVVYVWGLHGGDRPPLKWRHQRGLCALTFGADGRLFGGGVGVWSWPSGATAPDWTALTGTPVDAVAVNADRTILAVAAADKAIHLWRLGPFGLPLRERADQRLTGHDGMITGLAFDPDGRTLASCATKTEIRVWVR